MLAPRQLLGRTLLPVLVFLDVFYSFPEQFWVVAEHAEAGVTELAEETSQSSSLVVVVEVQGALGEFSADGAASVLLHEQVFVD